MSSPSQLFSCTDAPAILNSPLNTSPAKYHYAFPKDSRFKKPKINCDQFYETHGIKDNQNRATSFGFGKKTDLDYGKNPEHIVPSPDTYNLQGFIDINKLKQKGFTPLYGRDETAPMSYINLEPAKNPGPGRYDQFRYNQSPKWSLRPRVQSQIFPQTTVKIVPGPGTYVNHQAIELNLNGQYHLSNHRNSKAKIFNPPRSRRFNKSVTDTPGVGAYQPRNELSNEGKYVLSRNVSAGKRTFMAGRRLSFTDIQAKRSFTPGPGSYRPPSDFGHYDSKQQRMLRLSVSQNMSRSNNNSSKSNRTKTTSKSGVV